MLTAEITIDRELHALIPPLEELERQQLEENLKLDGCRDPLVVWKGFGILLDGHNRHDICSKRGIGFRVVEIACADKNAAKAWIIRNQFGRRNLNDFQRAELAIKLKPLIEDIALANQRASGGAVPQKSAEPVETRREIARIAKVSHDTITKVESIRRTAVPALAGLARRGDISINAAATIATLSPKAQKLLASGGPSAIKTAAKEIRAEAKEAVADAKAQKVEAKRHDEPLPRSVKEVHERSPRWRWLDSMEKLQLYIKQPKHGGWFDKRAESWSAKERDSALKTLVPIRDELNRWIGVLEKS